MFLNNTSQYNSRLVRQIIRHAANVIPIDDVMINIKNSKHQYGGMAYSHLPYGPFSKQTPYPKRPRYLVVCRIGAPQKFPFQCSGYPGRKIENGNWPTPLFANWQEAMVFVMAHELMHIQQFRHRTSRTEKETEAYGMARLIAWRALVAEGRVGSLPESQEPVVARPRAREEAFKAKLTHSQEMLKRNLTKLKRAETLVKKWRAKNRYYEKKVVVTT